MGSGARPATGGFLERLTPPQAGRNLGEASPEMAPEGGLGRNLAPPKEPSARVVCYALRVLYEHRSEPGARDLLLRAHPTGLCAAQARAPEAILCRGIDRASP
jgi:hypothetical protein